MFDKAFICIVQDFFFIHMIVILSCIIQSKLERSKKKRKPTLILPTVQKTKHGSVKI